MTTSTVIAHDATHMHEQVTIIIIIITIAQFKSQ